MGQQYYYLFTVWKEPEHEMILERRTTKACKEYFGMGEKWDYWREKVEAGKVPEYSLIKERSCDLEKPDRPIKGEDLDGNTKHMIWGESGEVFMTSGLEEVKLLCGACKYWIKDQRRSRDGRLHGYCSKLKTETERCTWCMVKEETKCG